MSCFTCMLYLLTFQFLVCANMWGIQVTRHIFNPCNMIIIIHVICCVLFFCLLCRFGIRRRGPFTHLFFQHFFFYSGEEHFTFTSVQSLAGRLVVIEIIFFLTRQLNLHCSFQKTPAESRQLNKDCILLDFYDNHDIWHFLSASAMFCTFMVRHKSTCMESSSSVLFLLENRISQHPALASGGPCMYTTNVLNMQINKSWYYSFQQYTNTMHPW